MRDDGRVLVLVLAVAVAVLHAALVAFVVAGGALGLRRPRLLLVHAAALLAVAGVHVAGADCPLTTLEQALRDAGGAPPLRDGFLGHYVFSPLGLDAGSSGSRLAQQALVVVPNVVVYAVLARRHLPGRGRVRRRTARPVRA